jgi:hypothetical protein
MFFEKADDPTTAFNSPDPNQSLLPRSKRATARAVRPQVFQSHCRMV